MTDRPKSIDAFSPNFTPCDKGRVISCIVLHATAGARDGALATLRDPKTKVSAHYLIDEMGAIYNLVDENNIAWHAGESFFKKRANVNHFSIGIELVNPNDGVSSYPAEQLSSCAQLCGVICKDHGLEPGVDIVGHAEIAIPAGRKTDPAGFPWESFKVFVLSASGSIGKGA